MACGSWPCGGWGAALKCHQGTCSFPINGPAGRKHSKDASITRRSGSAPQRTALSLRLAAHLTGLSRGAFHSAPWLILTPAIQPVPNRRRSHWDEHNSPDLHDSFFFSQFISSRITHLSQTSEEDEDHTRAAVTLCFSNEACALRLLAFAMLPFETAATRRSHTFSETELAGCNPVCVPLGSVAVFCTCLRLKQRQT